MIDRNAPLLTSSQRGGTGVAASAERAMFAVVHAVFATGDRRHAGGQRVVHMRVAWKQRVLDLEIQTAYQPAQHAVAVGEIRRGFQLSY